jgi:hypothetical protein
MRASRASICSAVPPGWLAVGVGNNEESLPTVRSSDIGRSNNCPFRSEPRFGKVGEDSVESENKVP